MSELPGNAVPPIDEDDALTLAELCRLCAVPAEEIIELVEQGVIDPPGVDVRHWRFHGVAVRRVRCAVQLHRDLGVNWAGAALALDLLDRLRTLRRRERIGGD